MVLLKNEKNLLPLTEGTRIALFGKGKLRLCKKGGGGSGDVMVSYVHNLYDGLKMQENAVQIYEPLSDFYRTDIRHQYEKGAAPGMTVEPELSQELADGAKAFADVAVVVISRFSARAGTVPALNATTNLIHGIQKPPCRKFPAKFSQMATSISLPGRKQCFPW